ncbi:MAG: hypothetical protein NTW17_02625 [Candidatus Pacearchaeota archaeon]|nr:hypothetical protein [Candidatus Pacearchaeota archaeon]
MGFIRRSGVVFFSFLLFFSFLASNSLLILGSSLKYDNVKDGIYPIVKELSGTGEGNFIPKEVVGGFNLTKAAEDAREVLKEHCTNATSYVFSYKEYTINIPCEYANSTNPEEIINKTFDDVIYNIYYKDYGCDFWDCFSKTEQRFFLVSEKAHDYWMGKFYLALLISVLLVLLVFLFVAEKRNGLIITGALLILSVLPLLKLDDLIFAVARKFSFLVSLFLSSTNTVFWFSFILGIILIVAGIGLKIWGFGKTKQKVSKKEEKSKGK